MASKLAAMRWRSNLEEQRVVRARELGAYTVVGTVAMALHVTLVASFVPHGWSPLVANLAAFVFSFSLSFIGHARFSFPATDRPLGIALRRFTFISVVGFGLNEAAYAGTLVLTPLDYRLALVAVIAAVGFLKLLASKHWAFALP
jgi:putative flippase GtrA